MDIDGKGEVMVYFYDLWAELLQYSQEGDEIIISGPKDLVFLSELGDNLDLVIRPDDSPNYSPGKLTKLTLNLPSVDPFTISSDNLIEHYLKCSKKRLQRNLSNSKVVFLKSNPVPVPVPDQTVNQSVTQQFLSLFDRDEISNKDHNENDRITSNIEEKVAIDEINEEAILNIENEKKISEHPRLTLTSKTIKKRYDGHYLPHEAHLLNTHEVQNFFFRLNLNLSNYLISVLF